MLERLRREHEELRQLCKQLDATSQPELVEALRARLVAHLAYEDDAFYPALEQVAEDDPRLWRVVKAFVADCKRISEAAQTFFDGLASRGGGPPPEHAEQQRQISALHRAIVAADNRDEAVDIALTFFEYSPELWHGDDVPTDIAGLVRLLRWRIDREERILFPLYTRYVG